MSDTRNTSNVSELYSYLDGLIPSALSASWDNDGCMCLPDPTRACKRVLLALDATDSVIDYAVNGGFDLIVTHHPLIFHPLPTLRQPKLFALACAGVAVFSFHTRLDAVQGGVNDCLAAALCVKNTVPFGESIGRIGTLDESVSPQRFAVSVRDALGCRTVCLGSASKPCRRVAVVGGAGGDFIEEAIRAGADTLVTGELRYHEINDAAEQGINLITAGHFETERPVLHYLNTLISAFSAGITTEIFSSGRIDVL